MPFLPASRDTGRAASDQKKAAPGFLRGRPRAGPKSDALLQRRLSRDGACLAGQLYDMQARIGPVRDVDVAAVIDLSVVALDHNVAAALLTADRAATRDGRLGDRRNEIADLL